MPIPGHRAKCRGPLLFAWSVLAIAASSHAWAETAFRNYEPQRVTVPLDAPYLLPDGSVYIVGDDTMEPLLKRLNDLFVKAHPGIRFTMLLRSPPTGIDGIQAGVSLFAPVAHDAWETEIEPFKRLTGYRPLDVRIGRRGYAGAARQNPPAIYVNASNPLPRLTLDQVGRIFTNCPAISATGASLGRKVIGPSTPSTFTERAMTGGSLQHCARRALAVFP